MTYDKCILPGGCPDPNDCNGRCVAENLEDTRRTFAVVDAQRTAMPAQLPDAEQLTIRIVQMCAKAGFDPRGDAGVSQADTINTCAIIIEFCKLAMIVPNRTLVQWIHDIEHLNVTLRGE